MFFDGERPEVARVPGLGYGTAVVVAVEERTGRDLLQVERDDAKRQAQDGEDREEHQDGRQDAEKPAAVEGAEGDRAGLAVLLQQAMRDEEAADREEEIDAQGSVDGIRLQKIVRQARMAKEHHRDSDGSPAVEGRKIVPFG